MEIYYQEITPNARECSAASSDSCVPGDSRVVTFLGANSSPQTAMSFAFLLNY